MSASPYKTAREKLDYERRLPTEIIPFVRAYFAKHKEEILKICDQESIAEYLNHIQKAWREHIKANEAIDCFLSYESGNIFGDWSPEEWKLARQLLVAGFDTDHQKTLYSGGVKHKLDTERISLIEKYKSSGIDGIETILISPAGMTFYEGRVHDHKKYHLSVLKGEPDLNLKTELLARYHGNDPILFEERLRKQKFSDDINSLQKEIEETEELVRNRSIRKKYITAERQDLKDYDALLNFDNATEYEYTYSLKGLPDLFLREEVLKRLVEAGRIDSSTSVYALTKDDFLDGIDKEIAHLERHFFIRLRPYYQTQDTCGTACVLSILNRVGVPQTIENEMTIWEKVGRPYNFPGGLGLVLREYGFNVRYVQDSNKLLDETNPEFQSSDQNLLSAAKTYVSLHEKAVQEGMAFEIKDWDFSTVKSEVMRGNPCILYIYASEVYTHCVIARGVKNDRLEIIDPLGAIKYLDANQLNSLIQTSMGKRMLVVQKLPKDFYLKIREDLAEINY